MPERPKGRTGERTRKVSTWVAPYVEEWLHLLSTEREAQRLTRGEEPPRVGPYSSRSLVLRDIIYAAMDAAEEQERHG